MRPGKDAFAAGLAAFFVWASPADAACDWPVAHARPAHAAHATTPPPLAIGDSTMVFAVPYLAARGFEANARVCRTVAEGLRMVRARKRAGRLPRLVVLALGANSPVRPRDVAQALGLLGPHGRLVLLTHRTWFGRPGSDTVTIRRTARRYGRKVRLIDWVRYARPHPGWFGIDGLHPTETGARAFADLIARAAR